MALSATATRKTALDRGSSLSGYAVQLAVLNNWHGQFHVLRDINPNVVRSEQAAK
jgi:hypothetical protein